MFCLRAAGFVENRTGGRLRGGGFADRERSPIAGGALVAHETYIIFRHGAAWRLRG